MMKSPPELSIGISMDALSYIWSLARQSAAAAASPSAASWRDLARVGAGKGVESISGSGSGSALAVAQQVGLGLLMAVLWLWRGLIEVWGWMLPPQDSAMGLVSRSTCFPGPIRSRQSAE